MISVYTMSGIPMIHIQQFADLIGRSKQSTRHLIEEGNSIRNMKFYRDRSRLMIPLTELAGYPFVNQGRQMTGRDIYHYQAKDAEDNIIPVAEAIERLNKGENITFERALCPTCTFAAKKCIERMVADQLEVPEGDK